jgi:hypothetical protein
MCTAVLYNSTDVEYRMTPVDYAKHKTWLTTELKALMAPGSNYRPELAFNGEHCDGVTGRMDGLQRPLRVIA